VVPAEGTFDGTIEIALGVPEPTATLWLDARDLDIGAVTLSRGEEAQEAAAEQAGPR
jgi:aminopeptidase N